MAWRALMSRNLQSVKLMACVTSPTSAVARDWWVASYAEVKHLNPRFPFQIRPNPDAEPFLIVEYDFARKVKIPVAGMKAEEIDAKLAEAVAVGDRMPRAYHQSIAPFVLPAVIE